MYLLSLAPFQTLVLKEKSQASKMKIFFPHNFDFGYVIETCHIFDNQYIQNYYTDLLTSSISNCFTVPLPTF